MSNDTIHLDRAGRETPLRRAQGAREGSVGEPEPVGLVGHVDDATWSYDVHRPEVEGDHDDGAGTSGGLFGVRVAPTWRCACQRRSPSFALRNARPPSPTWTVYTSWM